MTRQPLSEQILDFYKKLAPPGRLPGGIKMLNPYGDAETMHLCELFYSNYYQDINKRRVLLGINPGRLGAGLAGIPFTDPIRLQIVLGIENSLDKKPELSSEFVYKVVEAFGGPEVFYKQFLISSVCPLGFTLNGKNINYYDDLRLAKKVTPFIIESLNALSSINIDRAVCFCIGEGKNYQFLSKLNSIHGWFGQIRVLPHPRFVMQYKRKLVSEYVNQYVNALKAI